MSIGKRHNLGNWIMPSGFFVFNPFRLKSVEDCIFLLFNFRDPCDVMWIVFNLILRFGDVIYSMRPKRDESREDSDRGTAINHSC